jgi:hypothetical protein
MTSSSFPVQYYDYWLATVCLGAVLGAVLLVVVVAIYKNKALATILIEFYRRRGVGIQDQPQEMVEVAVSKAKGKKVKKAPLVTPEMATALLAAAAAVAAAAPRSEPTNDADRIDVVVDEADAAAAKRGPNPYARDPLDVSK